MPYLVVDNFSAGLDTRRHVLSSKDGTLAVLKNAHITRGGEIEKRKAFSLFATLPDSISSPLQRTFGMETADDKIYVFHSYFPSNTVPPDGITFQKLLHPFTGSVPIEMTKVVWSTVYGGKPFVIAEFSDGNRFAYWNNQIVKDWYVGVSRADNTGNSLNEIVNEFSLPGYTCSVSSGDINITGPAGKKFTVTASISANNNTPGSVTVSQVQAASGSPQAKEAVGSFTVTGGSECSARLTKRLRVIPAQNLPIISALFVDGVNLLPGVGTSNLRWDDVPLPNVTDKGVRLAYTLFTRINQNTSATGYSATFSLSAQPAEDAGLLTILAPRALGATANNLVVQFEFEADPVPTMSAASLGELVTNVVANPNNPGRFLGTAGTLANGATNGITSVSVDGVQVIDETVLWRDSNSATAQAVADAINAFSSTPDYTATASNGVVSITTTPGVGSLANGRKIFVGVTGNATVSATVDMAGGEDIGTSQITKVATPGWGWLGRKITITVTDPEIADPYVFGASRVAGLKPNFSVTYKAKEYAAVGSTMYFSSLNDATKWDIYDLGSGFIDMSNNFGGRESLTGFGVYQDKLAVFSRRNVQLWFLDADPAQNQQLQILANTGCIAPDSVVSMGAIDLLYLADNGIRSLRARESTDTAFASDIGSAIDDIVISHLSTLTDEQKASAKAIVDPVDGRYWLAIGNKIYVLSYFPGSNIAAWSVYEPGFSVDELAVLGNKIYVRSGKYIYLYGGANGNTYDSSEVVVEFPYMDARKPATYKRAKAVDLTIEGLWKAEMGCDHTNPGAREVILRASDSTFAYGTVPVAGIGTHFGLRMVNQAAGYAKISNVILHYDELQPKHEAG